MPILKVNGVRNVSKIFKAIVRSIAVYMVNVLYWPATAHIEEGQPVRQKSFSVNADDYIALYLTASNASRFDAAGMRISLHQPCKCAGLRLIVQKFFEAFLRKHGDHFTA